MLFAAVSCEQRSLDLVEEKKYNYLFFRVSYFFPSLLAACVAKRVYQLSREKKNNTSVTQSFNPKST